MPTSKRWHFISTAPLRLHGEVMNYSNETVNLRFIFTCGLGRLEERTEQVFGVILGEEATSGHKEFQKNRRTKDGC
jgi:hypothetical protein